MAKFGVVVGAVLAFFGSIWVFTSLTKVPAGNVGVKVYLLGSDKGVDSEEVGPGRYWVGWNQDMFLFPTFTQNYVWTAGSDDGSPNDESITFQTAEGMTVNADIGISYNIIPGKVNEIFQKYRKGVDEITDTYLRNMVRDAIVTETSNKSVEYVYGAGKAELMANVEKRVRAQVDPLGINIERIYWIGTVRLPDAVIASLNAKIQATQMAAQRRNEVEQSKAEADKKVEEARGKAESILLEARAQAEANALVAKSITPTLVQYKMIEAWSQGGSQVPKYLGGGSSSGLIPFMDVTKETPNQ